MLKAKAHRFQRSSLAATLLLVAGCILSSGTLAEDSVATEPSEASRKFAIAVETDWQFQLDDQPLFSSDLGDKRGADRLPEVDLASWKTRERHNAAMLDRLNQIDRSGLSEDERLNFGILKQQIEQRQAESRFLVHLAPINARGGFHTVFPQLPSRTRFTDFTDYENYLSRLLAFKRHVDQNIELMQEGIKQGIVLPCVLTPGLVPTARAQIFTDPRESPLFEPFVELPDRYPQKMQEAVRQRAEDALRNSVMAGYETFASFLKQSYVPACRESISASALPNGDEFYAHRVKMMTTLDVTPQQVHETGLAEIARIRQEMEAVKGRAGFAGNLGAYIQKLRNDPKQYVDTKQELLDRVARILKQADGQLPKLFGQLPRAPYGIKEIPAYIAPYTTTAYYEPPAGDGTRAGFYAVNTYDLPSRPLYELEALSLHEAVPGHHLQIALSMELEGQPLFRRYVSYGAFIEGWALYAERLGYDMGFYTTDESEFGRLTYEAWRAARLVVDTGIHAFGWTRQQAIDYMLENTALTEHNVTTEVDRYIGWPGQALGYKMGELKIRELRARAEESLAVHFDLRAFHDAVLGAGAIPLDLLAFRIDEWIEAERDRILGQSR